MLLKRILAALAATIACSAFGFTTPECKEIAENVFAAQSILNIDKSSLDETHAGVKATPAKELGWSEEQKEKILAIVDSLKPGQDPQKVGMAVFNACRMSNV